MGKYVLGHDLKGEGKLRNDLISSDQLNDALVDTFLGYCADPILVDSGQCLHRSSRSRVRLKSSAYGSRKTG